MAKTTIPSVLHFGSKLRLCRSFLRAIAEERHNLGYALTEGTIDQAEYDTALVALDNDEAYLRQEITALTEIKYQKAS